MTVALRLTNAPVPLADLRRALHQPAQVRERDRYFAPDIAAAADWFAAEPLRSLLGDLLPSAGAA